MNYFKEEQYFRQKLLWLVILFSSIFYVRYLPTSYDGQCIGDKPLSDEGVITFSLLVGLGLPVLFWFMKLKLRVSSEGLHYQFFPYISKND